MSYREVRDDAQLTKTPCPCGCGKFLVRPLFHAVEATLCEADADELVKRWNGAPTLAEALKACRDELADTVPALNGRRPTRVDRRIAEASAALRAYGLD